ncbi:MAG: family 20 glycosylhydrolase [Victivallales bacterium]|nr:family 20 glycosylhydrolase [Victivallales bacterium]
MKDRQLELGLKLYLPAPDCFGDFEKAVRIAADYGYDFIMLELGGAMEYKRHPEINQGWLEYAAFMNEYPGKTLEIQHANRWAKNSIHTENGGGKVLSQEQIKQLIAICDKAGLEIFPEVPSLSHCDYLLTRHPELAERDDDKYPDTACPSNPDYQRLIRDVLEEVIEVFHPKRINICHDECYSICKCPRCRGKVPHELYAEDINNLASFLLQRGVTPFIWGEKLLDAHCLDGEPIGGAAIPDTPEQEGRASLYQCGELIDKNVRILHWYWSVDRNIEERYQQLGLQYWFGNTSLHQMQEAGRRLASPNCKGIIVSNWGSTDLTTMQRNEVLYNLVYVSLATRQGQNPDDYETLDALTRQHLYELFRPKGDFIEVIHTTHTDLAFQFFFDGRYYREKDYLMGHHVFSDENGTLYRFPVIFGTNISNDTAKFGRFFNKAVNMDRLSCDMQLIEATGAALPIQAEDGKTYYKTRYALPSPGLKLRYVRFEPASVFVPPVIVKG